MRARQERPKGFASWHNFENALKSHIEDACPGMVIVEEDLKKGRYGSAADKSGPLHPRYCRGISTTPLAERCNAASSERFNATSSPAASSA